MTRARSQGPPGEVESALWGCPLCGAREARPVRVTALKAETTPRLPPVEEEKRQRLWQEYLADPGDDVWDCPEPEGAE